MGYCSAAELVGYLGEAEAIQLSDPQRAVVQTTVLEQAILRASSRIDSYLEGRYALPLSVVPETIRDACLKLATHDLYRDGVPDRVRQLYEDAIGYLRDVAAGRVQLPVTPAGAVPQSRGNAQIQADGRVFGRGDRGFI